MMPGRSRGLALLIAGHTACADPAAPWVPVGPDGAIFEAGPFRAEVPAGALEDTWRARIVRGETPASSEAWVPLTQAWSLAFDGTPALAEPVVLSLFSPDRGDAALHVQTRSGWAIVDDDPEDGWLQWSTPNLATVAAFAPPNPPRDSAPIDTWPDPDWQDPHETGWSPHTGGVRHSDTDTDPHTDVDTDPHTDVDTDTSP